MKDEAKNVFVLFIVVTRYCQPSAVMPRAFTSRADDQGSIPTGDRASQMKGRPPNHGVNGRGTH